MSPALAGFSFTMWVMLIAIDSIYAAVALEATALDSIIQFSIFREAQVDLLFLAFTFPAPNIAWFASLGDVLTFNQGIFAGWANWIRVTVFLGLSAAFVVPLILMLFGAILTRR